MHFQTQSEKKVGHDGGHWKTLIRMFLTAAFALELVVAALAQTERGTIRGTVQDSSGAFMAGVKVTAVNVATGVAWESPSTGGGLYNIPNLPPGTYRVTAEMKGFKQLIENNVVVAVAAVVGLDLKMEVGAVTENITVTAAPAPLQTENTERALTLSERSYTDLPLSAGGMRSPENFFLLSPGATGDTFATRVNGSQALSREIQLEGMSVNDSEIGSHSAIMLNQISPDAVQEFSVATSTYSAEFGNSGGGIMRYTVRSGTNNFHGNVYEYFKNAVLDTRGFFAKKRAPDYQNEFGGSIGGPIEKDRTFFFFNFNGFRLTGGANNLVASVPPAAFRGGDLSGLVDSKGNMVQLYDPASTRSNGAGGFIRDPFPGNIIPASRMSPVSKGILSFVPLPNVPGAGLVNNFISSGSSHTRNNKYTFKINHNFNAKHRISGSGSRGSTFVDPLIALPRPVNSAVQNTDTEKNARLAYDWVITPSLLAHLSVGANRAYRNIGDSTYGQGWGQKLGLTGVPNGDFPSVNFGAASNTPGGNVFSGLAINKTKVLIVSNTFLYGGNLSWLKGKNNWKFGADFRKQQDFRAIPSITGTYNFNANETALPTAAGRATSGDPFASFLVGTVDSGSAFISDIPQGMRWTYLGAYVQDDIKLTPTLTVNAGLRWDLFTPIEEAHNQFSILDPTLPNSAAGGLPGALIFAGFGPGRIGSRRFSTERTDHKNFGPRLGIAWQFRNNWVLRTGYGISYFANSGILGGPANGLPNLGFTASPVFLSQDLGVTPAFNWTNGFPQNFQRPPFIDPTFGTGGGASIFNPAGSRPAYRQDWNFGFQHELAKTWLLDIAYVGSKGTRLNNRLNNPNQVNSKFLSLRSLLTLNINDPAVVAAGFTPPFPGFTGSLAQALRPFPQYSSVGDNRSFANGNSTYHALQAQIQRKFSQGLMVLANYTLSKNLSDSPDAVGGGFFFNGARDTYNRRIDKSLSLYDQTHIIHLAVNYELPIGPRKRFLKQGGAVGKFLEGWQVNAIGKYNSGEPLAVVITNNLPLFNGQNVPDIVPGVNPCLSKSNFDQATSRLLNINAFRQPAPFTIGNAPVVLNNCRIFPLLNEDFGIEKRTLVGEKLNIDFRFEMFNAFNRTRFGVNTAFLNLWNFNFPQSFGRIGGQSNSRRTGQFTLKVDF